MTPWLVVPTLGNRDASLVPLLAGAGMPSVVVHTGARDPLRAPVLRAAAKVVRGVDPMNIQRWWNLGIENAVRNDADVVVVCNDDVAARPGALLELAAHIEAGEPHSPMLVWPDDPVHAAPRVSAITGYCFALDPARIRPDESFSWWYGDNDLELRARAMRPDYGVQAVNVSGITHLRTGTTYDRPVQHLINADRELFARRYPDLMGGWR